MKNDSTHKELEERLPIWNFISEFYLDTELQDYDYESITKIILRSNLSLAELKEIDLLEVFPVLQSNLLNVVGEWEGFNEQWLKESCTQMYFKRKQKLFRWRIRLSNYFFYSMRKDHWQEIEKRIQKHKNPEA